MKYNLVVPKKVRKEINKIDSKYRAKIKIALTVLARDPFLGKKLEGSKKNEWSFRVWPYRIIYKVHKKELLVLVIKVGHRQGIYK